MLDDKNNWRIMLRVDADAIVILEVFAKKARVTSKKVTGTSGVSDAYTDATNAGIHGLRPFFGRHNG